MLTSMAILRIWLSIQSIRSQSTIWFFAVANVIELVKSLSSLMYLTFMFSFYILCIWSFLLLVVVQSFLIWMSAYFITSASELVWLILGQVFGLWVVLLITINLLLMVLNIWNNWIVICIARLLRILIRFHNPLIIIRRIQRGIIINWRFLRWSIIIDGNWRL